MTTDDTSPPHNKWLLKINCENNFWWFCSIGVQKMVLVAPINYFTSYFVIYLWGCPFFLCLYFAVAIKFNITALLGWWYASKWTKGITKRDEKVSVTISVCLVGKLYWRWSWKLSLFLFEKVWNRQIAWFDVLSINRKSSWQKKTPVGSTNELKCHSFYVNDGNF